MGISVFSCNKMSLFSLLTKLLFIDQKFLFIDQKFFFIDK